MCTVVVLNGVRADFPVVLATNRDEFYARPTSGPALLRDVPNVVTGTDLVAGGTWMGVSSAGLFVGLTNQRTLTRPDPRRRSRGEVVFSALKLGERKAITQYFEGLDGRDYNPFNLMWGDADEMLVGYAREGEEQVRVEVIPRGIHVLPNDVLDSADFPKVSRALSIIEPHVTGSFDELSTALKRMLADRHRPELAQIPAPQAESPLNRDMLRELAALCIRTPVYGTRSSTIVALAKGQVGHYLWADGAPDVTEFVDVKHLFA